MMEESKHLSADERLNAENQFLKLKLLAEHGGQFYSVDDNKEIPTELENQFLANVIEFERQFSSGRTVTVFEKIGSPQHFKNVSEIADEEIDQAWENLYKHMTAYGVELSACSPKATPRELYRFTTEELFTHETDDISIPGMVTGFIYDEFHPDPEHDNARTARYDCMQAIFRNEPLEWMPLFSKEVRFNDHCALTTDELKDKINRFKDVCDEIELDELNVDSSKLTDCSCVVRGTYSARLTVQNQTTICKGKWEVLFVLDEKFDDWSMKNIQIEGLLI